MFFSLLLIAFLRKSVLLLFFDIVSLFNMRPANNYILQRADIMVNGQNDNQAQKVMLFINNRYQGDYYLIPQKSIQNDRRG